ncbi:probable carboxylesterase 9 [Mercurialis annua]|uniref:probable carboxylesterase 9 n=1 Tax=Mercurialis annua TaxID=3986 RepID=UPI00215EAE63|nr:probable carboxylesterase 9 [Mercurialis annua]
MARFDPYEFISLQPNKDGTFTRLLHFPLAKTNDDPSTGEAVLSKDAMINGEKNTKVRLYFPIKSISNGERLPVVYYFHGCSWVHFSADNPALHLERKWTACTIPALVILVLYRLAPETRLPGQYDDAEEALLWTKRQALDPKGEPWLKNYADFSKCFLSGSGNGGNIVFHMGLRVMEMDLNPLKFIGLIMNQPLFGGVRRTESEIKFAADQIIPLPVLDLVWKLTLPKGVNRDHRFCNPMVEGPHQRKINMLPPCLVLGFGMDPLIDRQREFVQLLMMYGVKVEAHFDEIGFHRIEIVDAKSRVTMLNLIKQFIHTQIAYVAPKQNDDSLDRNDGACHLDMNGSVQ